jgi:prophage antirepressor-like protein
MQKLEFRSTKFNVIQHSGEPHLTLAEVARALYAKDKGGTQSDTPLIEARVRKLYSRHADEFRSDMTALVRMQTPGGMQDVRIFSLRGCHLLGMFARTDAAKNFRAWALNVLDAHMQEGKGWQQAFNQAWLEYTSERAVASICGKGLRRWQDKKTPMQQRVVMAAERAQVLLPF